LVRERGLGQVVDYDAEIVESLLSLAVGIARKGHEGRRIGKLFTIGIRRTTP
jgi:hypothetical protein